MVLDTAEDITLTETENAITSDVFELSDEELRSSSSIKWLHQHYPNGSRFTDTFDGASECMGFAYYCYYMYNDGYVEETIQDYSQSYYSLGNNSNLENFLRKAGSQCYVRGLTNNGSIHSIFIIYSSTTEDTVTVYDCNMDGNCGVLLGTYSYNEFRQHMASVLFCYTADGDFLDYTDF